MAAKPSKFSSIFAAAQEPEETVDEVVAEVTAPVSKPETSKPKTRTAVVTTSAVPTPQEEAPVPDEAAQTKVGKKMNPDYKQVTAYVRRDLHENVTRILFDDAFGQKDAKRKEFSELVGELLDQWLERRQGSGGHNDTSS